MPMHFRFYLLLPPTAAAKEPAGDGPEVVAKHLAGLLGHLLRHGLLLARLLLLLLWFVEAADVVVGRGLVRLRWRGLCRALPPCAITPLRRALLLLLRWCGRLEPRRAGRAGKRESGGFGGGHSVVDDDGNLEGGCCCLRFAEDDVGLVIELNKLNNEIHLQMTTDKSARVVPLDFVATGTPIDHMRKPHQSLWVDVPRASYFSLIKPGRHRQETAPSAVKERPKAREEYPSIKRLCVMLS
ncbi:hypothetical protein C8J57DRAFT_1241772 [Mycena rebaudengoi]|nr:hypothetical protein C8J57DRAFT_1241772 [Mycena rebaudengoi]